MPNYMRCFLFAMIFISRCLVVVHFLPWNFVTAQQKWKFSQKSPKRIRNWNLLQGCSTLSQQIHWVTRSSETQCNKCFCLDLPKDLNANITPGKLGWTLVAASPSGVWFFFFFSLQSWWNSLQLHLHWGCDLNLPKQAGQVWKPDTSGCMCFLKNKGSCRTFPKGCLVGSLTPLTCLLSHRPLNSWQVGQACSLQPSSPTFKHASTFLEGIYSLLFSATLSSKGLVKPH